MAKFFLEKIPFIVTIILSVIVFGSLSYYLTTIGIYNYFQKRDTIIEGVLVEEGFQISKISPIITSNIPIENSITNMIFEPLYRVRDDGTNEMVLAESIALSTDRKTIDIILKQNILWSDGKSFDADDVIATFEVLKSLKDQNASSIAVQEANITKINDYEVNIIFKNYSPTLFEELNFGILPKHILDEDNPQNFLFHKINKLTPIGTGPFVYNSSDATGVKLTSNKYYREKVNFQNFYIKFYNTKTRLIEALKNSQIHLTSSITDSDLDLKSFSNLTVQYSNALEKRYWAMYFNLSKGENISEEDKKGLEIVGNVNIRKAISLTIDRSRILNFVGSNAKPMYRFLPESSFVFQGRAVPEINYQKASEILDADGWVYDPVDKIRVKDGQKLRIRLAAISGRERTEIVDEIVLQLKALGIQVTPSYYSATDLANTVLKAKRFDILLYGVDSYIDTDRFRLWHSTQISLEGLNFSSYKSSAVVKDPISGKEISKSDDLLVRGRVQFDIEERKKTYLALDQLISEDIPAVFLYHPSTQILLNKRLKGIQFEHVTSPSDIYFSVKGWSVD